VTIDPSGTIAAALGPGAIPVPGFGPLVVPALSSLVKIQVKGEEQIAIEFPHPIIWYPFMDEADSEKQFYLIDSNEEKGTFCSLELRKFNPDTEEFDRAVAEKLKVEVADNPEQMLDAEFLRGHIQENGFYLRTKRVVIGKDKREGGSIRPSREEKNTPPAQNQGIVLPVWYKMHPTATISAQVFLGGEKEPAGVFESLEVNGETVTLYCPNLPPPPDTKGNILWQVTGPNRAKESGSGFKTQSQSTALTSVTSPEGKACAGAEITIVQNALTQGDPVRLDVKAPGAELDFVLSLSKVQILGDEQDEIVATVKISPKEAGGKIPTMTKVNPSFKVDWGKCGEVSQIENGATIPITANWSETDIEAAIVEVEKVEITRESGSTLSLTKSPSEQKQVKVIGAKPQLTLEASPKTADADGTSMVTITPKFTLFDEPYAKELTRKEVTFSKNYFEEPGASAPAGGSAVSPVVLQLRCLFHLRDDVMKNLESTGGTTELSIKVGLTDAKDASHYPDGIPPAAPAKIHLRPCRITLLADRATLPGSVHDPRPLFVASLRASVETASGKRVDGKIIRPGATPDSQGIVRSAYFQLWTLRFRYNPPLKTRPGQSAVTAIGVDDQGRVMFEDKNGQAVDFFEYDHLECCWDNDTYELDGQNCRLTIDFEAENEIQDSDDINIGEQVKSVCVSWDYSAFYLSNGQFTHAGGGYFGRTQALDWLKLRLGLTTAQVYERKDPTNDPPMRDLLPKSFPQHTILIGGGGHHGIVVYEGGRMTVRHFLMALPSVAGKPAAKWFNRDQIRKMEHEQKKPVGFADAYAYIDTLDEWLARNSRRLPYEKVEVWSP